MKHCGVFDPKKTNEYDLCRFYQVGLSGDLPDFPTHHKPATLEWVSKFLLTARSLGQPNLIIAHWWDSVMAVCLLQELHKQDSHWHLLMEPKADAAGKAIKKLSFCPFCMYSGSNDPSYMSHIICSRYNAIYGCGKCLKEVFTTGQLLKNHMKVCKGLPKEAADEASVGSTDHTPATLDKKHASKDPSPGLQLPPQSSQGSQCAKKKPALTPKKSDSGLREEECSSCHKHHSKDKSGEKSNVDKHSPKSPTESPARSPARRSAARRISRARRSGTTLTRSGRTSLARSEPVPLGTGGTPSMPNTTKQCHVLF